nr:MAG TPA: hypothetical protein [Bacteriophage sp.]
MGQLPPLFWVSCPLFFGSVLPCTKVAPSFLGHLNFTPLLIT